MAKNTGLGRGLGRGLSALLDDAEETLEGKNSQPGAPASTTTEIDIDLIDTNPWQPRTEFVQEELDELAASISSVGIITPLTVRKVEDNGRFQLIAGERRLRAAKQCGLKSVPAYIREVSDDKMLAVALIENIQRANLNPIEEAISYQRLINECQLTQEVLADHVGKKRSTVTNYLRLLKLPNEIQDALRNKKLSMGQARAIMGVDDMDTQMMLFRETIEQGYSVRHIEELVREYNTTKPDPIPAPPADRKKTAKLGPEYQELGAQLSSYFGVKVKLACGANGKGKITIPFANDDDLLRIMELLDKSRNAQ